MRPADVSLVDTDVCALHGLKKMRPNMTITRESMEKDRKRSLLEMETLRKLTRKQKG